MNHVAVLINLLIYDESFCFDCLEFIMRVICLCELFGLQDSLEEEIYFNLNGTFLEKNKMETPWLEELFRSSQIS